MPTDITGEALAEMERRDAAAREAGEAWACDDCYLCSECHVLVTCDLHEEADDTVLRLIAALRASRAEIEQLEAELERLRDPDGYETEIAGRHVGYSIYPK